MEEDCDIHGCHLDLYSNHGGAQRYSEVSFTDTS